MILRHPIPSQALPQVASLYWQAFGPKLHRVLGPTDKALAYTARIIDPTHGFSVHDTSGQLLGVAGFKTRRSALVRGNFSDLRKIYGFADAFWRYFLISLLGGDVENQRFLIDGIFVDPAAQGRGVGTTLLRALCEEAQRRGYHAVRLDVIDSNHRARALYLREGFTDLKTDRLGLLRHIFGFDASTAMVKSL